MSTNDSERPALGETLPRRFTEDAADLAANMNSSVHIRSQSPARHAFIAKLGVLGVGRRALGLLLVLVTVLGWTVCNFLASFMFSDNTYDKPFFMVYVNTSLFAVSLIPKFIKYIRKRGVKGAMEDLKELRYEQPPSSSQQYEPVPDERDPESGERLLIEDDGSLEPLPQKVAVEDKMTFRQTALVSLEFCLPWFFANYFASACFEYTSVASGTIFSSTSSVWTLLFGALYGVEAFSVRKLTGVLASLAGIILISTVDLTGESDEDRGSFPHKTPTEIAIGDVLALVSAIVYGVYGPLMKLRVPSEEKADMRMLFGLLGVFNLVLLWPLFFVLHWTGLEPFELPPDGTIWLIIIVSSVASFLSDVAWAFAMLLTTPLVVTVGLSLTIPLSLIGEMIQYGRYSSFVYWIGAAVVLVSFLFINHESPEEVKKKAEEEEEDDEIRGSAQGV